MRYEKIYLNQEEFFYLPRPENYGDCLELINSDLHRWQCAKKSKSAVLLYALTHPFSFLVWHRLCAYKGVFFRLCKAMLRVNSFFSKIDIPYTTRIGYGLYIGHKICIVINEDTIIGNNVNIGQFLNIGTNHNTPAIIGDNVYIGPSVCIIEDVKIGAETTIGAGAVVTRDLPAGSTCAGSPAKVLNFNNPGRYVTNRYEFSVPEGQR